MSTKKKMSTVTTRERVIVNYEGAKPEFDKAIALKLVVDAEGSTKYFPNEDGSESIRFNNESKETRVFVGMKVDYFQEAGIELLQDEAGIKFIKLTPCVAEFKVTGAVKSASL